MILNHLVKYVLLFTLFLNSIIKNGDINFESKYKNVNFGQYLLTSIAKNQVNIPEIYLTIEDISFIYSKVHNLI